jgi:hypothetical protein
VADAGRGEREAGVARAGADDIGRVSTVFMALAVLVNAGVGVAAFLVRTKPITLTCALVALGSAIAATWTLAWLPVGTSPRAMARLRAEATALPLMTGVPGCVAALTAGLNWPATSAGVLTSIAVASTFRSIFLVGITTRRAISLRQVARWVKDRPSKRWPAPVAIGVAAIALIASPPLDEKLDHHATGTQAEVSTDETNSHVSAPSPKRPNSTTTSTTQAPPCEFRIGDGAPAPVATVMDEAYRPLSRATVGCPTEFAKAVGDVWIQRLDHGLVAARVRGTDAQPEATVVFDTAVEALKAVGAAEDIDALGGFPSDRFPCQGGDVYPVLLESGEVTALLIRVSTGPRYGYFVVPSTLMDAWWAESSHLGVALFPSADAVVNDTHAEQQLLNRAEPLRSSTAGTVRNDGHPSLQELERVCRPAPP